MITLVLESSTYEGSVALLQDDVLLDSSAVAMRGREREALMPAVALLLDQTGLGARDINRIVCGSGPGAFTSLRIAGSIAKGLALALGVELRAVSSLALLAGSREPYGRGRYVAAVDAMRGEHYVQCYETDDRGDLHQSTPLEIVASPDVDRWAASQAADAIGPDRTGIAAVVPRARAGARITNMIESSAPVDLARWEPAYGRLAEAQVKWEAVNGRPLLSG